MMQPAEVGDLHDRAARRRLRRARDGRILVQREVSPPPVLLEGRAKKLAQVNRSLPERDRPEADQRDVWERIEKKARQLGSRSKTGAMRDIFDQRWHSGVRGLVGMT